jgi:hypothetical protein
MAQYYSNELAGDTTGTNTAPVNSLRPSAGTYGARQKVFRATIAFNSQAAASTFVLAKVPTGHTFSHGLITVSATTGSATISIGNAGAAAQYAAAAAYTTADTPTLVGKAAAMTAGAYTAEETIIATTASASLPASGNAVIELFFDSAS